MIPRDEFGTCHLDRLACLFRRAVVDALMIPISRRLRVVTVDRPGRSGRYAGVRCDDCLLPGKYQRRQEQLSPVACLAARHRRPNSLTSENTPNHLGIELVYSRAAL